MKNNLRTIVLVTSALLVTIVVIIAIVVYYNPNPSSSKPRKCRQGIKKREVDSKPSDDISPELRLPISAGVLTYYAPKTLEYTLTTYRDSGLLRLVDDFFVVIQKSDRQMQEKEVCEAFKVRYILLTDNGHMASGFKAIYDNARNQLVLFLENDFIIEGSETETRTFLENALYFINEGHEWVKGRSRDRAGEPNFALMFHRAGSSLVETTHLSESIYWDESPEQTHPSKISAVTAPHGSSAWYSASSKHCNYSNNPYLCKRSFFKAEILPHLVFGENIEDRLTPMWALSNHKCIFGPGLFTHNRSYDGHT